MRGSTAVVQATDQLHTQLRSRMEDLGVNVAKNMPSVPVTPAVKSVPNPPPSPNPASPSPDDRAMTDAR